MKARELIDALSHKLETNSQAELAAVLGISVGTLRNWSNQNEDLSPLQVASALSKSRSAAVTKAHHYMILPVVEFYKIDKTLSKGVKLRLIDADASLYANGLKQELEDSYGIYIFYDSRGRALYVGKAREQTLWKEMNLAFNRAREVQKVTLVRHPEREQEFKAGYEKLRQPRDTQLELTDLAHYFSAYDVDKGAIDDLEALLVRGFANDLLNMRMETFANSRS